MERDPKQLVREHLKVLLLHFAKSSETPGDDLQALLHELINELYVETENALRPKKHLKLVGNAGAIEE